MKKKIVFFSVVFTMAFFTLQAQSGYGIKMGLGYNSNGKLKEFVPETESIIKDKGSGKSAFNIGFYGKLDLGPIFLRPELVYTRTTSEYDITNQTDYKVSMIEAPVLLGIKIIGPLDFIIGPSFQYILDNDLKGLRFDAIENDFTIGLNLGVAVAFGRFGIDVRYDRGFSENEADFDVINDIPTYRLDSRPEQLIFSLSYRLSDKRQVP